MRYTTKKWLTFTPIMVVSLLWVMSLPSQALPLTSTTPLAQPLKDNQVEFDLKQANKQFDQLNLQLSVENVNVDHLDHAITTLNRFVDGANTCIDSAQKKLTTLDPLLEEASHAKDGGKGSADLIYLHQEQKKFTTKLAQCRLFSIRAQEAISTYQATVSKIRQAQTLMRGLPLWALIQQIHANPSKNMSMSSLTLQPLPALGSPLFTGGIILVSIAFTYLLIRHIKHNTTTKRYLRVKKIRFASGFLITLCLLWSAFTVYLHSEPELANVSSALFMQFADYLLVYLWGLAFVDFLFKIKITSAFFYWYSLDSHFFKSLIIFLLSYYTLSIIGSNLLDAFVVSDLLRQLVQGLFLLGVLLTAVSFFYYFCQTHQHIHFIQQHRKFLQRITALLFLVCAIINILGYHALAMHVTYAGVNTFAIVFSAILIEHATHKLYFLISQPSIYHQHIRRIFGYKSNQTLIEFLILKTTIQIVIFTIALYLISDSWGYGTHIIDRTYSQLINGIHLATFTFYPIRIVAGIVVFCLLYLFFRTLSTKLSKHSQFEDEEETQVAVASILTYLGFACALITALYISGIDFTGLAIVAGALSVGIGLGLQSIVNNFVSGIILLIEKPIKPGDRISIDGLEGTVKKIRVRSTQMTTSAREDVIIPNSNLITHSVTNFMYSDTSLSIHCEVGVAYDTDPQQVRQLLLQAANEHGDIIKTSRIKPNVLFHEFGDSAMIFQIWFLIKDGNKKSRVQSDINFSIERLFREHHIKIACPQRDINVTLSDKLSLKPNI